MIALQPLVAGAYETFRFRTFSPKGGFYYDGVVDISQDNEGFIWVMLDNELLRFDGYEYRRYSSQFRDSAADGESSFISFALDADGNLHVLTTNAVYQYDISADSFRKEIDSSLTNIAIDCQGNTWCMKDNALHMIAPGDTTLTACSYDGKPIRNIRNYGFGDDKLFFASGLNVYVSEPGTPDSIELMFTFPPGHSVIEIRQEDGDLWALTARHGLYKIDTSSRCISRHLQFQDDQGSALAKTFLIDKKGRLWVGTQLGMYIIDPVTGESQSYRHSKSDPFSLPNNSVWTLFADFHGNIWVGHFAGGLCYADLDDSLQVMTYTSAVSTLNYELVSSFAEDEEFIYIGMDGGGLNCLDKKSGKISKFGWGGDDQGLLYHHVKSMVVDADRRLWVAKYRDGLSCFDLRTKHLRNFRHDASDPSGLKYNDLRKIIPDKKSGLWIAYQNISSMISYLSFDDYRFTHYELGKNDGYVFDIQMDSLENVYALTRRKIFKICPEIGKIEELEGSDFSSGQAMAIDASGNVWIGTIGKGLVKYEPSTGSFKYIRYTPSDVPSAIYSMCHDGETDCLWLGTDNGLVQFDIRKHTYRRFDECDGFQGQVYYPLSTFRNSSGRMFFGGTNGFSILDPGSIKNNTRIPNARISGFYIDNHPVSPSMWKSTPTIELRHDQANFGFRFSSDSYRTPEKNSFKYRLKGYDEDWITTDANNRTAMYAKVPPGTYEFEVLAANNDGVWNDKPATVRIVRLPAPWASPLAFVIYSLLAVLVMYGVFYYWNEKRKLKTKLFVDSLDKQKKEELHKSQLRFFTNISHDFRTPISLILAVIDNIKQEGMKESYYRILHNNSRRLLNLVNELMDFSTIDNNKMKLQVQHLDANALVRTLASDFEDYARKRDITFTVNCDPDLKDSLCVDKQVLEKVVMNLLNNAFKYTPDGGEITIETYSSRSKFKSRFMYSHTISSERSYENELILAVRDTGCGITAGSIKDVFERYNMVNTTNLNKHLGTGIGLALVKSLVLLHHGEISIYSERNKGTDMVVALPIDCEVFKEDEFAPAGPVGQPETVCGADICGGTLLPMPDGGESTPEADCGPGDDRDTGRKRILLVEDHTDLRTLIAGFLKLHYDISEAADGVEAIEVLRTSTVDLIISDIMMPNKDGIELCREVKENIDTSHIPVMLLTARTGVENQMEGVDAGADLYFSKPIDFNLLLQSVRNLFRHQNNLKEHYARNYYADRSELSSSKQDADFLNKIIEVIDANLEGDNIDVNLLASELCMSRSKLYSKIKALTGKSIVKFILNYRMRKAAKLIVEQDIPLYRVMELVGIRSQSYFVNTFKEEFGETPSSFMAKHRAKS